MVKLKGKMKGGVPDPTHIQIYFFLYNQFKMLLHSLKFSVTISNGSR